MVNLDLFRIRIFLLSDDAEEVILLLVNIYPCEEDVSN